MDLAGITLDSGRRLTLIGLHVSSTYRGWMEGVPTPSDNDRMLERLAAQSRTLFGTWPVHLIDSPRTLMPGPASPRGPHEQLPHVTCIGRFESTAMHPAGDALMPTSNAIIVWFQDDFSSLFGDDSQPRLRAVPWEAFAQDGDW